MGGIFGTKWTNSHGIDPTNHNGKTWRAVLKGISEKQIQDALNVFSDTGAIYIPTATEFKDLCRYGGMTKAQAAFKQQAMMNKGLPILPASKDFARDQINKAREILK